MLLRYRQRMARVIPLACSLTLFLCCSVLGHEEHEEIVEHHWMLREYRTELRYQMIWICAGLLIAGMWMLKSRIKRVLLLMLVAGTAVMDTSVSRNATGSKSNDSALIALAGQFRVVFANLLWIKLDNYHHEYIAHHRDWTKNSDAVGLSRMITKLDPHFEEAYASGGRMLLGLGKVKDARDYLQEGVDNNPNSMLLHDEMGTVLAVYVKDYKPALFHFRKAYELVKNDEWERNRLGKLIKSVEDLSKDGSYSVPVPR